MVQSPTPRVSPPSLVLMPLADDLILYTNCRFYLVEIYFISGYVNCSLLLNGNTEFEDNVNRLILERVTKYIKSSKHFPYV